MKPDFARFVFISLAILGAVPAAAAPANPTAPPAPESFARVTDAKLSPDGKNITFTVAYAGESCPLSVKAGQIKTPDETSNGTIEFFVVKEAGACTHHLPAYSVGTVNLLRSELPNGQYSMKINNRIDSSRAFAVSDKAARVTRVSPETPDQMHDVHGRPLPSYHAAPATGDSSHAPASATDSAPAHPASSAASAN